MNKFSRDPQNSGVEIKSFKPRALNGEVIHDYKEVKAKFGSLASTDPSSNSHFSMHPDAKKSLGVEAEEKSHLEDLVSSAVEARLIEVREKAYEEGFAQGREDGKKTAEEDFLVALQPQFEKFVSLLNELNACKHEVYLANEQMLIQLIFEISRNVLIGELKMDRDYVKRITAEIVDKLGVKEQIKLKISRKDYENIEQLREFLKIEFPDLKNLQVEPADDMILGGIKVETDLSRINASVEAQFKAIQAALSGDA
jgi:flagellar assembly protein FliH